MTLISIGNIFSTYIIHFSLFFIFSFIMPRIRHRCCTLGSSFVTLGRDELLQHFAAKRYPVMMKNWGALELNTSRTQISNKVSFTHTWTHKAHRLDSQSQTNSQTGTQTTHQSPTVTIYYSFWTLSTFVLHHSHKRIISHNLKYNY